jgi:hypothetical protein
MGPDSTSRVHRRIGTHKHIHQPHDRVTDTSDIWNPPVCDVFFTRIHYNLPLVHYVLEQDPKSEPEPYPNMTKFKGLILIFHSQDPIQKEKEWNSLYLKRNEYDLFYSRD